MEEEWRGMNLDAGGDGETGGLETRGLETRGDYEDKGDDPCLCIVSHLFAFCLVSTCQIGT